MKNILILVVFCFAGALSYSQKDNVEALKTISITYKKQTEPSAVTATAVKADVSISGIQKNLHSLKVVKRNIDKTNKALVDVKSTAVLETDVGVQSKNNINLKLQTRKVNLERQTIPINIKPTVEKVD